MKTLYCSIVFIVGLLMSNLTYARDLENCTTLPSHHSDCFGDIPEVQEEVLLTEVNSGIGSLTLGDIRAYLFEEQEDVTVIATFSEVEEYEGVIPAGCWNNGEGGFDCSSTGERF